jgi:hypothetical protein
MPDAPKPPSRDDAFDDPAVGARLITELERVLGPVDGVEGDARTAWLLPTADPGELLTLLREAPSGIGLSGFERLLRARFGTLAGLTFVPGELRDEDG